MLFQSRRTVWALLIPVFCLGFAATIPAAAAPGEAPLAGVHRIVFLGDSITYSGQYVEEIEACRIAFFRGPRFEIINLGLPSETVSGLSEPGHAGGQFPRPDLHERLGRVLEKTKPDLVVACYGMNDGIYLPFDEERFKKFRDGIEWLHDQVLKTGAKILHVTPPTFDEVKGGHPGYGAALDRYSEWLVAQRSRGWDVVDIHTPMGQYLADHRKVDPNFFLAGDGVHCGEAGHWIMARAILVHWGFKEIEFADSPVALLNKVPNGVQILKLVQKRQRMMKDAWLTETRHLRPGMNKGLPLPEAQAKANEIETEIHELAPAATDWGQGSPSEPPRIKIPDLLPAK